MNIKKLAALTLAATTAGATLGAVAFGQISGYVATSNGNLLSPTIVIGNPAQPSSTFALDVLAAADVAAHVAGYATTPVTVAGAAKEFSSTMEGKSAFTSNTKIYLDDSLGKSGLRSTLTKDDLPTLLASGNTIDKNSTNIKYDQFLFLTPGSTTSNSYKLQFERPSSSSQDDGTYSIGRFPTSSSATDYFLDYRLNFKKDAQAQALVGKTLKILGETYTVLSDSASESGTIKLVATKAAVSQSVYVSDGEVTVTVGTTPHVIKVIGTSDSSTVVVSVDGESQSATKSATTSIHGVDVYVDDVFHFANNQDRSGAKLLIGAEKIIFQHSSKIKVGSSETNVDGTFVSITTSGGKFSTIDVYLAAPASSVTDNLKAGSKYTLPSFSKLALFFPGISEDLKADSRNVLKINPSGDNVLQATWKDFAGRSNTFNWAYKASSTGTTFSLADNSGNPIWVKEGVSVAQDQYLVLDAGDFPRFMRLTSVSTDSTSFTLTDVMSGDSVKYDLSSSDLGKKTIYIDGQAYYTQFSGGANTTINFTWGPNAGYGSIGKSTTVWPTLKGKNSERLALTSINETLNATHGVQIQLPTGAVNITMNYTTGVGQDVKMNLTAVTDEDGEASVCAATPCVTTLNLTTGSMGTSATFALGKTGTGGLVYNVSSMGDGNKFNITVVGTSSQVSTTQPGIVLYEEKDSIGDRYSMFVAATTETSGSNYVAIPAAPIFTNTGTGTSGVTRGADSTISDYVDLYGVYYVRTTSGQDTATLYYPDDQVYAVIGGGDAAGIASIGGGTGSTVQQAVHITSPVAKLDSEIPTPLSGLSSDLILIGGPCANDLVATLVTNGEINITGHTVTCSGWTPTKGIIKEVANAFGSTKKALVIAGTNAVNTRELAAMVLQGTLDYAL